MKKACVALTRIFLAKGRNDKLEVLRGLDADTTKKVKFIFETALNPFLTYGVSEVDYSYPLRQETPTYEEISSLRQDLTERRISGNVAREQLATAVLCEDAEVKQWLVSAFTKSLRIGIAEKAINMVYPGLIPEFPIGLCDEFEDVDGKLPEGNWLAQPKFDGLRCLAFVQNGVVRLVSRGNKDLFNIEHIVDELTSMKLGDAVLDGELYGSAWNDSISIAHTKSKHADSKNLSYHIFDMMPLEAWNARTSIPYIARLGELKKILPGESYKHLRVVKTVDVGSYEDAKNFYKDCLKEGFEGIVLKRESSLYPFGRSKDWLKWKPVITVDLTIVGFEEGTGKHLGKLGAFICDYNGVEVRVGGGYSDEQRQKFWLYRKQMVGRTLEVEAQEATKDGALRFPVFLKVREDK